MPALKADLPDHLYWLTEKVEALVRSAAFLVAAENKREVSPQGGTRTHGPVDAPLDATWAPMALRGGWCQSPYDGESLSLQLNLEDVPAQMRVQRPDLPEVGVAWLTLDLSDDKRGWDARVYFDARPAKSIPWHPRTGADKPPAAMCFVLRDTLTCATDMTLPEISSDYRGGVGMCVDYDDWWQEHYGGRQPSDVQLGGWQHPIQGDMDELRPTLLLSIERQSFGDSGAIYLHYSAERGFWAHAETC
jgi:hypothetical protein